MRTYFLKHDGKQGRSSPEMPICSQWNVFTSTQKYLRVFSQTIWGLRRLCCGQTAQGVNDRVEESLIERWGNTSEGGERRAQEMKLRQESRGRGRKPGEPADSCVPWLPKMTAVLAKQKIFIIIPVISHPLCVSVCWFSQVAWSINNADKICRHIFKKKGDTAAKGEELGVQDRKFENKCLLPVCVSNSERQQQKGEKRNRIRRIF